MDKPLSLCAPKGAHFLIVSSFIALLLSLPGSAHTIVLSEYSLQLKNGQWLLSFDQKTSQLRDAIYASEPELKGINLNSEAFLKATANHITSNLSLTYKGEPLRLVSQHMHYGGLRFESRFLVEELAEKPDFLTMKVGGFDAHEHSIVLFRVTEGKEGYLNYFNQDQRLATFDFAARRYEFQEVQSNGTNSLILYGTLFLTLSFVAVKLFRMKANY